MQSEVTTFELGSDSRAYMAPLLISATFDPTSAIMPVVIESSPSAFTVVVVVVVWADAAINVHRSAKSFLTMLNKQLII